MNIEDLRTFCLSLKGTEEKLPFDDRTLVFYVKGKMFCLTDIEDYDSINIKCDPEEAIMLRERYEEVIPGYCDGLKKLDRNLVTLKFLSYEKSKTNI